MNKFISTFVVSLMIVSTVSAQNLPTSESDIRTSIQSEVQFMTCADVVTLFTSETVPALIEVLKNKNSNLTEQNRKTVTIVMDEIAKQLKNKCVQSK